MKTIRTPILVKIDPTAVKVMAPASFMDHDEREKREKNRAGDHGTFENIAASSDDHADHFRSDSSLNNKSCLKRGRNRPLARSGRGR